MKVKTVIDLRVICDPPSFITFSWQSIEQQSKALLQWTEDFHTFIRDHRSMDGMCLIVEKQYEDQCSHCHRQWETDDETGEPLCCNKAQEEWKISKLTA